MTLPVGQQAWAGAQASAHAVLAFDLDGPTGDAMLTGALWDKPGYFLLGSYGPDVAVPRILEILAQVQVRATFFTPAWIVEKWPVLCQRIVAEGHEIANHGHRHEKFYGLSAAQQHDNIARAQDIFERVLGVRAVGFRAPSGDLSPTTIRVLADCGFLYSSSMRAPDKPYLHEGTSLVELPARSLFDDYSAFAYHRAPNFPAGLDRVAPYRQVFNTWLNEFASAEPGNLVATIFHPKVIATPGRALLLEDMIEQVLAMQHISFVRADELARVTWEGCCD